MDRGLPKVDPGFISEIVVPVVAENFKENTDLTLEKNYQKPEISEKVRLDYMALNIHVFIHPLII